MINIKQTPHQYEINLFGTEENTALRLNAFFLKDETDKDIYLNITIKGSNYMVILVPASLFLKRKKEDHGIVTHYNEELGESLHLLHEGRNVKIITENKDNVASSITITKGDFLFICKMFKQSIDKREEYCREHTSLLYKIKKYATSIFSLPMKVIMYLKGSK